MASAWDHGVEDNSHRELDSEVPINDPNQRSPAFNLISIENADSPTSALPGSFALSLQPISGSRLRLHNRNSRSRPHPSGYAQGMNAGVIWNEPTSWIKGVVC
jgi:hypothetical protein